MSRTSFFNYSARKKQLASPIVVASLAKSIENFSHRFSDRLNIASFARQAVARNNSVRVPAKKSIAIQKGPGMFFKASLLGHVTMDPPPRAHDLVHWEVGKVS
jgi:hypothetical protein